jgi:hypothetical protein
MSKTNIYIIKYKIDTFIKDLIFVENYKGVKPNLFSITLRIYIEKHFNI